MKTFKHIPTGISPPKIRKVVSSTKDAVVELDVEKSITLAGNRETESEKNTEIPKKIFKRTIVRRSCILPSENVGVSTNDLRVEEVAGGVIVPFLQTYKDLETLLDMDLEIRFCSDLNSTLQHPRNILRNSLCNFNFFMNRKSKDPSNDHLDALGSLRCINSYQYPHPLVFHSIIHKIILVCFVN